MLQAFGALWLLIEIIDYFFSDRSWASFVKSGWWVFFLVGVCIGAYRAWPKWFVRARIEGTDVVVEVRIGDLFKFDGALIIGSNTTFDTAMEDNTISDTSIQGKFTRRYFSTILELDQKLAAALQTVTPVCTRNEIDKPYGKRLEYELGTVAPLEAQDRKAYFVAVSRLNADRVASSDSNSFLDALPHMWNGIRNRGGMEPLCCPILGSGYTRLKLTRQELVMNIVRSFVVATQEGKLSEKLMVVIHPRDMQQGHIRLENLGRFLEFECVYAQVPRSSGTALPVGAPIQ